MVLKKPSLITFHLIFVTRHLKYPNFLNPTRLAHYFQLFITQIFILFMGPVLDPLPEHHTCVYPLSPHKSPFLLFFFFFFFRHSPPIPRHTVLSSSLPLHSLPFTKSKQRRSPPHRVQIAPISSKGNPPSTDLHWHPACKITSNEQQQRQSPLS